MHKITHACDRPAIGPVRMRGPIVDNPCTEANPPFTRDQRQHAARTVLARLIARFGREGMIGAEASMVARFLGSECLVLIPLAYIKHESRLTATPLYFFSQAGMKTLVPYR